MLPFKLKLNGKVKQNNKAKNNEIKDKEITQKDAQEVKGIKKYKREVKRQ